MSEEKQTKRKHLIAVLGTGFYLPCTYYFEEQSCETKFVQEAVVKLACGGLNEDDRITVCLTEDARKRNWEDRAYSQKEIEQCKENHNIVITPGEIYQGLYPVLNACLKDTPGIRIEKRSIATGKDSREIAQMFSDIYDVIKEDEEIYFDITHGLRNIPMLVMTILEYARVTKSISVGGIFYGAFEVGTFDPNTKKKKVPIYDLSFYHTILNWTNAANSFIKYGHADEINDLVSKKWESIAQTKEKGKNLKALSGNLNNVANKLQQFTASLETGRGDIKFKDSIYKCYGAYESQQKMTSEHLVEEYYPFRELLDRIDRKVEVFKNADTNFQIGMATVDWCIDNHMVQQGYTALEETIKTFLCERLNVPQEEEFWRESVVKQICTSLYRVIEGERKELDEKFEGWRKSLHADSKEQMLEGIEKGEKLYEMIIEKAEYRELVQLVDKISTKRNDISHFGFTNNKASAEDLKKELEKFRDKFKEIKEKIDKEGTNG